MILFQDVTPRNFMSFGDTPIAFKLDRSPTTLITGNNGAGKSSIAEAVCFALFGKSFRGINKPDLINTTNQKGSEVAIRFLKNADQYVVVRGQKPAKFTITKNGEDLKEDASVKDFQEVLEGILGFDYNTFIKTVLIGHANYRPFLQLTLPERRQFVDVMLNVGIYTTMATLHKVRVANWKTERQTLDVRLDTARSFLDSANRAYARVAAMGDEKVKQLEASLEAAVSAHAEIVVPDEVQFSPKYPQAKTEKTAAEHHITDQNNLLTRARTLKESIVRTENRIEHLRAEFDAIEIPKKLLYILKANGAKERVRDIDAELDVITKSKANLKAAMMTLNERIKFFEQHDTCEVCEQGIQHDHKQSIIDTAREAARPLVNQYRSLEAEETGLKTERDALKAAIAEDEEQQQKVKERDQLIQRKEEAKERARESVLSAERELTALKSEVIDEDECRKAIQHFTALKEAAEAQIEEDRQAKAEVDLANEKRQGVLQKKQFAQRDIDRIKGEIAAAKETDLSQFLAEIEKGQTQVAALEVDDAELNERKRVLDACTELLKDSGIKASLVKIYIPTLNNLVNEYLESMGAQYKIELDENFNDVIKGRYKDEFSYKSLSQGERQRCDLATTIACIKVAQLCSGIETNLLILDEVGDSSMDYDGIEALFQIIERAYSDKNVFFVSHRVEMQDKCRALIRLTKSNGFTKIV